MAQMLPEKISEATPSKAEKTLFRRICSQLSADWCAIHSLGMTTHNRKPWAEIDFVLIGPPGVFCIEVKGGGIGRKDGVWTTTNVHGHTSNLKESPFAQVGGASAALYRNLKERLPAIREMIVGYAVATPDCTFNIAGPDIAQDLVYDDRDVSSPFSVYMDRIVGYWLAKIKRSPGREFELSPSDREAIRKSLMKDFDLRPTFRSSIESIREEMIRYTQEQDVLLQSLSSNSRVLVRGGAGTGKTMLALSEACRMAEAGKRVLLICFNRRLATFLSQAALDHKKITVKTFHHLMREIIENADMVDRLPDAQPQDLFRVFYPDLAMEALIERGGSQLYDVVIMDEGQDLLLDEYVQVLDLILCGGIDDGNWRVFLDHNQNLFGGVDLTGLKKLMDARPVDYPLTINCRNAKEVAVRSSILSGVPLTKTLPIDGGKAERFLVSDDEDQRRQVSKEISKLVHRGFHPQKIAVLSPRKMENSCLHNGLMGGRHHLVDPDKLPTAPTGSIGFATIQSYKGLEADAVLLVDLHDVSSDLFSIASYVGTTRARVYLALFIPESEKDALDEREQQFGEYLKNNSDVTKH